MALFHGTISFLSQECDDNFHKLKIARLELHALAYILPLRAKPTRFVSIFLDGVGMKTTNQTIYFYLSRLANLFIPSTLARTSCQGANCVIRINKEKY